MNGRSRILPDAIPSRVATAAAGWALRLQAPDAGEAEWLAFASWLEATPGGRAAYDAAMSLWLLADTVDETEVLARAAITRRWPGTTAIGLGGLSAIVVAIVAGAIVLAPTPRHSPVAPMASVYATAKGERRTVRLADGTQIDLSSASRMMVALAPGSRHVTLIDGEAAFTVTHDPHRPFAVSVGDREVRDLGTEFDIRIAGPQIRVSVKRGLVEVAAKNGQSDAPIALGAGRQLRHDQGSGVSTVAPAPIAEAFAWKQGRLIYRDQPLRVVVDDLNRTFPHAVRIEGQRTAALRFTGVLAVGGEDATIRRLVGLLPISATRVNGETVLKARD